MPFIALICSAVALRSSAVALICSTCYYYCYCYCYCLGVVFVSQSPWICVTTNPTAGMETMKTCKLVVTNTILYNTSID